MKLTLLAWKSVGASYDLEPAPGFCQSPIQDYRHLSTVSPCSRLIVIFLLYGFSAKYKDENVN